MRESLNSQFLNQNNDKRSQRNATTKAASTHRYSILLETRFLSSYPSLLEDKGRGRNECEIVKKWRQARLVSWAIPIRSDCRFLSLDFAPSSFLHKQTIYPFDRLCVCIFLLSYPRSLQLYSQSNGHCFICYIIPHFFSLLKRNETVRKEESCVYVSSFSVDRLCVSLVLHFFSWYFGLFSHSCFVRKGLSSPFFLLFLSVYTLSSLLSPLFRVMYLFLCLCPVVTHAISAVRTFPLSLFFRKCYCGRSRSLTVSLFLFAFCVCMPSFTSSFYPSSFPFSCLFSLLCPSMYQLCVLDLSPLTFFASFTPLSFLTLFLHS